MRLAFIQSLRGMLFSLVLLCVLPALGIILYSGLASRDHAIGHAREELVRMVATLSGAQQRTAEVTRQTLVTLSVMTKCGIGTLRPVPQFFRGFCCTILSTPT